MKKFTKFLVGLAFLMIGAGCALIAIGKSKLDAAVFEFDPVYTGTMTPVSEKTEEILIDVPYGYVIVRETEEASVTYGMENTGAQEIEQKEAAGCFSIRSESEDVQIGEKLQGFEEAFELVNGEKLPTYCIGIPKDYAGSIRILLAAGQLSVEGIQTEDFSAVLHCGEIVMKDVGIKDASLTCEVGKIAVDGKFTKRLEARTGVGQIDLRLDGDEKDYSVDATCDVGQLEYNGEHSGGFELMQLKERKGTVLSLQVEVGSLKINFN